MVSLNKALLNPYFLGGTLGGGWMTSHISGTITRNLLPWNMIRFVDLLVSGPFGKKWTVGWCTPPQFNSSPLKDGGWKTFAFPNYWVLVTFQWRTVKLWEGSRIFFYRFSSISSGFRDVQVIIDIILGLKTWNGYVDPVSSPGERASFRVAGDLIFYFSPAKTWEAIRDSQNLQKSQGRCPLVTFGFPKRPCDIWVDSLRGGGVEWSQFCRVFYAFLKFPGQTRPFFRESKNV